MKRIGISLLVLVLFAGSMILGCEAKKPCDNKPAEKAACAKKCQCGKSTCPTCADKKKSCDATTSATPHKKKAGHAATTKPCCCTAPAK